MLHSIQWHVEMTIAKIKVFTGYKVQYHLKIFSGFSTAYNYFQNNLYMVHFFKKKMRRKFRYPFLFSFKNEIKEFLFEFE